MAVCSGLYLLAGLIGLGLVSALEGTASSGHLHFSPGILAHSVAIFSAWLYGRKSILLLLPGLTLINAILWFDSHDLHTLGAVANWVSLLLSPFCFWAATRLGYPVGASAAIDRHTWKRVLAVSALISVLTYTFVGVLARLTVLVDVGASQVAVRSLLDVAVIMTLMTALTLLLRWQRLSRGARVQGSGRS